MFATFWIEEISAPTKSLQLQYVQNVFLNFPVLGANPVVNLTWPHVSVATLQKTFGGQWCSNSRPSWIQMPGSFERAPCNCVGNFLR